MWCIYEAQSNLGSDLFPLIQRTFVQERTTRYKSLHMIWVSTYLILQYYRKVVWDNVLLNLVSFVSKYNSLCILFKYLVLKQEWKLGQTFLLTNIMSSTIVRNCYRYKDLYQLNISSHVFCIILCRTIFFYLHINVCINKIEKHVFLFINEHRFWWN